jgi:hypothetical protein
MRRGAFSGTVDESVGLAQISAQLGLLAAIVDGTPLGRA